MVAVRPSDETSMALISGQPIAQLVQPVWPLSVAHCHVYLKSFIVSGWPSDPLRFGLRVTSTVNVLPVTTTLPLSTVGIDAARSGTYLPWESIVTKPRSAGVIASTVVSAVVK